MDAEGTVRALGLAGSMASGIFEYLSDGSPTKPFHAGWAAQAGVQAAALTAAGARGPASVLEGRFGLFATHVDVPWDLDAQLADLGRRWESPSVAIKPYPACHWVHAAVDAAVAACEGATPDDIERIVVRIPDVGVPIVLEPQEQKAAPLTPYDAKFSLPWCVAARLVHGGLDVRSFTDEAIADRAVLALAQRVEHAPWTGAVASPFAGVAEVTTRGGRVRSVRHEAPRGAPGNPMTAAAVAEKFMVNATRSLDEAAARAVAEAVERLEDADDVRSVTAELRGARGS
jgi:2-methylcitrate dehydratase PrpD